jgi:histone deacetylase 1/2
MDTGATDHITGDLERLTVRDKYNGGDRVHAANGAGMEISHIGHSTLHSPSSPIYLNSILHVPSTSKNLVSVNRLTRDNHAFIEFHPDHFVVKDLKTRRQLLRGPCEGGLYPVHAATHIIHHNKEAHAAVKPSTTIWHRRLGHAASPVVDYVLSHNKLPFARDLNNKHICDACQKGKSHQLPYPKSSSVSTTPLELVFSDVWGPAPSSVGHYSYYVSFIDDFFQIYLDLSPAT